MQRLNQLLKDNKGISNLITTLFALMIILAITITAIAVFKAINQYEMLNEYASSVIQDVCMNGSCDEDRLIQTYSDLTDALGIEPTITFDTTYYNTEKSTIQFGTTIKLTAELETELTAVGVSIPLHLEIRKVGKSEIYWK